MGSDPFVRHAALVGCVLSVLWLAAILAAPYGLDLPYIVGGFICHQRPERSFWIAGAPMPVCARCTGLYFSGAVGSVLVMVRPRATGGRLQRSPVSSRVRTALAIAAAPTVLTLGAEWLGLAAPSAALRAIAAAPLGFAVGWIVTSAVRLTVDSAETAEAGLAEVD